ncbi:hypothetical protein ACI4CV_27105, partial [Klebsiella pneumoniae]|uniref:hypothetical protein n=1 Tax=Klebsiella pneumoniae TaxID=573 RepID=UPI003854CCCD
MDFTKDKPQSVGYYWLRINGEIRGPVRLTIEDWRPGGIVSQDIEFATPTLGEIRNRPERKLF